MERCTKSDRVMDLILWRHAEAASRAPDQDDLERPLTPRVSARRNAWPIG